MSRQRTDYKFVVIMIVLVAIGVGVFLVNQKMNEQAKILQTEASGGRCLSGQVEVKNKDECKSGRLDKRGSKLCCKLEDVTKKYSPDTQYCQEFDKDEKCYWQCPDNFIEIKNRDCTNGSADPYGKRLCCKIKVVTSTAECERRKFRTNYDEISAACQSRQCGSTQTKLGMCRDNDKQPYCCINNK